MENQKLNKLIKSTFFYSVVFCIVFFGLMFFDSSEEVTNNTVEEVKVATTTQKSVVETVVKNINKALCPIGNYDFNCYQDYYTKLVKEKGVAAAFEKLKKEYETDSYVRSQCHPLTHVIGRVATTIYPKVFEAYEHGDPLCWSGYYHGVMEQIVNKIGIAKIKSELDNICTNIPGKERFSFDYYNCVHGLGHGLMAITDNELFDSLKYCDNLSGSWEKNSCYGGVFMENIIVDNKNHFTKYLKPEEPLYPCNAVEITYKSPCYLMQTSYMLKVTNQNFSKVFALCREADTGYRDLCYQSLGRDASGQSLSNAEATRLKCDLGVDYNEKSNCIVGAVRDFISYYHSDKEANVLCSVIASDLQKICLDTATSYYKGL